MPRQEYSRRVSARILGPNFNAPALTRCFTHFWALFAESHPQIFLVSGRAILQMPPKLEKHAWAVLVRAEGRWDHTAGEDDPD